MIPSITRSVPGLTPFRRDLLILVIGLLLLASPALLALDLLGGSNYEYESAEVVPTDTGIELVDGESLPPGTPLSDEIACSGTQLDRACGLERPLAANESAPLGYTANDTAGDYEIVDPEYQFVDLDDTVYRVSISMNESVTADDGSHPHEATLSPAIPEAALAAVSVDADEVSDTIIEAAEDGAVTTSREATVPETLVELDDGTYHRVFLTESQPAGSASMYSILVFFSTGLGIVILLSLSRKVDISVTYTDDEP